MTYYKKIEIKSEADLPKEKTIRICHFKSSDRITDLNYFNDEDDNDYWLRNVDWYLQPAELGFPAEDEIKEIANDEQFDDDCRDAQSCIIHGFIRAIAEIKKRNGL